MMLTDTAVSEIAGALGDETSSVQYGLAPYCALPLVREWAMLMKLDSERVKQLIDDLFRITDELRVMTGRAFTPDGHLVGSIGEVLAAGAYGLKLEPHSTTGCDATKDGRRIEIKATFGRGVAFRAHDASDEPDHVLVLRLHRSTAFEEIYNGPARPVLDWLSTRPVQKNGTRQISLSRLRAMNLQLGAADRLSRVGTQEFA